MSERNPTAEPILCQSCGCEFESERELQAHDAAVHGVGFGPDDDELADRQREEAEANHDSDWNGYYP
jgi:hypothetical protein